MLNMETTISYKTLVPIYKALRRHFAGGSNLHISQVTCFGCPMKCNGTWVHLGNLGTANHSMSLLSCYLSFYLLPLSLHSLACLYWGNICTSAFPVTWAEEDMHFLKRTAAAWGEGGEECDAPMSPGGFSPHWLSHEMNMQVNCRVQLHELRVLCLGVKPVQFTILANC